jgi:CRP/FNR family transcriptional regulator, cyclic AMP receptor protein
MTYSQPVRDFLMTDQSPERGNRELTLSDDDRHGMGSNGHALLDLLAPADRAALLESCSTRALPRRQVLFSEGERRGSVFLLRSGRVKLSRRSPTGGEVIITLCGAGELVGFSGLSRSSTRLVTAQVIEAGEAAVIDEADFRAFMASHPAVAVAVIEVMRHRMEAVADALTDIVSEDVPSRIVRLLRRLAQRQGHHRNGQWTLDLRLTHQEMANMIGARRQTVTTAINDLHRTGILKRHEHQIVINEPKAGRKVAAAVRGLGWASVLAGASMVGVDLTALH